MTARDDAANIAADAFVAGWIEGQRWPGKPEWAAHHAKQAVDALAARPDVLAAWATEVGALEQVGWICERLGFVCCTDTAAYAIRMPHDEGDVPVFRVADRTETTQQ